MKNTRIKLFIAAGIFCLLTALALRAYLYVMGAEYIPVTTDEALTVLQAKDVLNGQFPLLLYAQPYMFPLEAYWMAPLVHLTPRTAYGMRILVCLEGLVFLWLSIMVLRRIGSWKQIWPGILLALFPSVYLVMNQFAYSQPHNNSAFILALAAAWCALGLRAEDSRREYWLAGLTGFFALSAFSNAMLSLSLVVPVLIVAVSRIHWRRWFIHLPLMAFGGMIGLIPYVAAILKYPGAHQSVSATRPWAEAMEWFWSPAIKYVLPVTFGITPCLFPDSGERLMIGASWKLWFSRLFVVLLWVLLIWCVVRVVKALRSRQVPRLQALECFFGVSLLSLLLFTLSTRSDSSSYRYLVPVVVSFPFIIAGLYAAAARPGRWLLGVLTVPLVVFNIYAACLLPQEWKDPDFATEIVSTPDLEPAIEFMKEQGIQHCVASHWAAYRITFLADHEIICSQPFNERFHGWPVPFKEDVDASTNVAYVLTEKIRFLKPSIFERHMRTMGVRSKKEKTGHFNVYYDFEEIAPRNEEPLPDEAITFDASHNPAGTGKLIDGDVRSRWQTAHLQTNGMYLSINFAEPVPLSSLVLHYHKYHHDMLPELDIRVRTEDGWIRTHEGLSPVLDKFTYHNGHPVYGGDKRTVHFDVERPVEAIRLEAGKVDPNYAWTITEVEVKKRAD